MGNWWQRGFKDCDWFCTQLFLSYIKSVRPCLNHTEKAGNLTGLLAEALSGICVYVCVCVPLHLYLAQGNQHDAGNLLRCGEISVGRPRIHGPGRTRVLKMLLKSRVS